MDSNLIDTWVYLSIAVDSTATYLRLAKIMTNVGTEMNFSSEISPEPSNQIKMTIAT